MKLGEVLEELCKWRKDGGYSYLEDEKTFKMWALGKWCEIGKRKFFRDFINNYREDMWEELKALEVSKIEKDEIKKSMKVIVIDLNKVINGE